MFITKLLRQRHGIGDNQPDDFTVLTQATKALTTGGLPPSVARAVAGNVAELEKVTLEQLATTLERASRTMTWLLAAVAAVSIAASPLAVVPSALRLKDATGDALKGDASHRVLAGQGVVLGFHRGQPLGGVLGRGAHGDLGPPLVPLRLQDVRVDLEHVAALRVLVLDPERRQAVDRLPALGGDPAFLEVAVGNEVVGFAGVGGVHSSGIPCRIRSSILWANAGGSLDSDSVGIPEVSDDTTALQRIATVVFEPREQGIVRTFEITGVSAERLEGQTAFKDVTISTPLVRPDGRTVDTSLVVTLSSLGGFALAVEALR